MPRIRYKYHIRNMEETNELMGEVTVVDVYDIASDIGKECEKIIDQFGADAVTSLMPKVINALELLETLAVKNERENNQLIDLRSKISQLESDKIEKAEYRHKFEKELEVIEEQWRAESKELLMLVSKLQEENRRLLKEQQGHTQAAAAAASSVNKDSASENDDMLQKLQSSVEKQRDEIRLKEKLLQEKCSDVENMKAQVDRLNNTSRDLRRKHKTLQNQVHTLCDERADFLVQLQDQQRNISALRQRLGLAQKENEDLAQSDVAYPSNMAVFDLDDPNRPRFTITELKDILHERNELKARVSDLEDELETYRPKNLGGSRRKPIPSFKPVVVDNFIIPTEDDDAPVQGPLPYEPEDAPWKKSSSESGVRKFFRKLFSESSGGSSFPRRSLSTLTKMALSATDEPIPV